MLSNQAVIDEAKKYEGSDAKLLEYGGQVAFLSYENGVQVGDGRTAYIWGQENGATWSHSFEVQEDLAVVGAAFKEFRENLAKVRSGEIPTLPLEQVESPFMRKLRLQGNQPTGDVSQ